MKKQTKEAPRDAQQAIPRSRALIAVPVAAPRRGILATLARLVVGLLLLPVRLPILAVIGVAKGALWLGRGLGRGAALVGVGLGKLIAAPFILVARLVRLLALGVLFVLKVPFVVLRLLARGGVAVAVPVLALAWGAVRSVAAGVAAVVRGIAWTLAFAGRLMLRGGKALGLATVEIVRSLAIGLFVCVRGILRLALWLAILPFRAAFAISIVLARGVRSGAGILAHTLAVAIVGIAEIVRGVIAVAPVVGRAIARRARPVGRALATGQPQYAALLPLGALAALAGAELLAAGGFPFATLALLIVAACAYLAILSAPASMLAVLLAWGLAVAAGWRAESVSADTSAWLDALVYLAALAAVRSAYVTARAFVREAPSMPRADDQERAHRRASRAIGIVLALQCLVFAIWSGAEGRLEDAPLFGELLLVGAGMALAWVVRTGHYVRTAQFVLSLGALAALVLVIAAQLRAFADGRVFTAASIGAGFVLLLVAGALTVVVHARLIDAEHGA